jgi:hypothetical protein
MGWSDIAIGGHWWETKEPRRGVVVIIEEKGRHRHSAVLISGKMKSQVRGDLSQVKGSLWWRQVPGGGAVIGIGEVDRHGEILVVSKEESRVGRWTVLAWGLWRRKVPRTGRKEGEFSGGVGRLWAVVASVHWYGGRAEGSSSKNDPTAAIVYP